MKEMMIVHLSSTEWMLYTTFDVDTLNKMYDLARYSMGKLHFPDSEYDACYDEATGDSFFGIRVEIETELNDPNDEDSHVHEEFHFSFEEDPVSEMFGTWGRGAVADVCDIKEWARMWFGSEEWFMNLCKDMFWDWH